MPDCIDHIEGLLSIQIRFPEQPPPKTPGRLSPKARATQWGAAPRGPRTAAYRDRSYRAAHRERGPKGRHLGEERGPGGGTRGCQLLETSVILTWMMSRVRTRKAIELYTWDQYTSGKLYFG